MNKLALVVAVAFTAASFGGAALARDNDRTDFYHADQNHDNFVTFDEASSIFPTLTRQLFEKVDGNHDGRLTESEYSELLGLTAGLAGPGAGNDSEHHEHNDHHEEHHQQHHGDMPN